MFRALNLALFWGAAVVGFALRAGKEGLEAGTKLCTCTLNPSIFVYASDF
jgi:hypothetical protein